MVVLRWLIFIIILDSQLQGAYNNMEEVLQKINRDFISLPDDEVARNNLILREVLEQLTEKMKKNKLFSGLFKEIYYGGSYYDGVRVGKPEEYDLDILFHLPAYAEPRVINSDYPGFVHVRLEKMDAFDRKRDEVDKYPGLRNMLDNNGYILTSKVSEWMEGVFQRALNDFPYGSIITTTSGAYTAKVHKAGPAFTLKLNDAANGTRLKMDIDLVPCFRFTTPSSWPASPYRPNPVQQRSKFFVVPKQPYIGEHTKRYWRLSFQIQEGDLINGLKNLKPAMRLIKKLRDTQDHACIASYYIKTIFLWELEENKAMFNKSLTFVFLTMLNKYQQYLEAGTIPYYWNEKNNLIEKPDRETLQNFANRVRFIIKKIENNPQDVFKYLLEKHEHYTPVQYLQDLYDGVKEIKAELNDIVDIILPPESSARRELREAQCTLL